MRPVRLPPLPPRLLWGSLDLKNEKAHLLLGFGPFQGVVDVCALLPYKASAKIQLANSVIVQIDVSFIVIEEPHLVLESSDVLLFKIWCRLSYS